jgi:hypothetical protein
MPSDPTWAGTADPYFVHPPPDALVQACRVAVVLLCEWATTVITRVALPVPLGSGSDCPRAADVARVGVTAGRTTGFGFAAAADVVRAAGRGWIATRGADDFADAAALAAGVVARAIGDVDAAALDVTTMEVEVVGAM